MTKEFAKEIKSLGPKLINWTGDVRSPIPKWFYDIAHEVDLTLFSSITDAAQMVADGYKANFLQIGYKETLYKPISTIKKGIVFLGNNYKSVFPLSEYRFKIVSMLKTNFKSLFSLYGHGWPSHFEAVNLNNNFLEEARVLGSAEIVISLSHFNYSRYFSDRLLRALGSGAFVLSHEYTDIDKDFQVGKHLMTFKNEYDLMEKIKYYLLNKEEANIISSAGQKFCEENCTNMVRLHELESFL